MKNKTILLRETEKLRECA